LRRRGRLPTVHVPFPAFVRWEPFVASFDIDPAFAAKLDWVRSFVADDIEPLDVLLGSEEVIYDKSHPIHAEVIRPLQDRVRDEVPWSCHPMGETVEG
jgi:hypothetical protein